MGIREHRRAHLSATALLLVCLLACALLAACTSTQEQDADEHADTSSYLTFLDVEPVLVDPQLTSKAYTVPLNIYDRLVEVNDDPEDNELAPSLAESWELSDDGLTYTFRLREGVTFSNGSELTAEDVKYTFQRLLTHPGSSNYDLVTCILGADELRKGTASELKGFHVIDDLNFSITLEHPSAAFLAGLSTPGASILDEESTSKVGDMFGTTPDTAIGTGPFVLTEWVSNKQIIMTANKQYWNGAPRCDGLKMMFYSESSPLMTMYTDGELDILDLDMLGMDAEYFLHGDIYFTNIVRSPRVGITYIALNESVAPLNDVRVRKALQLSLDRQSILQATIGGRGVLENGIFPRGLSGHNPNLASIPYDIDEARRLLREAGYENGFDLQLSCLASSSQSVKDVLVLAANMWEKVGVRATIEELDDDTFLARRKAGELACYTATWSADYNDPENFIYTFFGTAENSRSRSLCYTNEEVMRQVHDARAIIDEGNRIATYQALEEKIVQQDAAWIPLYSKYHFFVVSDRVDGFEANWNGWSSNCYANVAVNSERR